MGQCLEVVVHALDGNHRLLCLILGHGIVLQGETHHLHLRKSADSGKSSAVGRESLSLDGLYLQIGVKVSEETGDEVMETIEHRECAHQSQRSQRYTTHRDGRDDVDSVVRLL